MNDGSLSSPVREAATHPRQTLGRPSEPGASRTPKHRLNLVRRTNELRGRIAAGNGVLIFPRPDVHRVIVRAVLRAGQTVNFVNPLSSQHLFFAHEINSAVLGASSFRWLRLPGSIH